MKDMTLVVLAAGMGSRYGGLKQIEPMGPNGEILIDYSIFDACRAGFNKVIFIIKEENFEIFKEVIGNRIEKFIKTDYVFQKLDFLPKGYTVPVGREKPWGTTHAVLCCEGKVQEDFCVINADDFYGSAIYGDTANFLSNRKDHIDKIHCCMAGYHLKNTVTPSGTVSRGVCAVNEDGFLASIVERKEVGYHEGKIAFTQDAWKTCTELPLSTPVSMNFWGFSVDIIPVLKENFRQFLETQAQGNPLKSECILPTSIGDLLLENACDVKVLETTDTWFGVTYASDKETVVKAIGTLIEEGKYPVNLWG